MKNIKIIKKILISAVILAVFVISCGNRQENPEKDTLSIPISEQTKEENKESKTEKVSQEDNVESNPKRFGKKGVGFVEYPDGWTLFKDPNAPDAMQISKDGVHIITLSENMAGGATAAESLQNLYNGFLKIGFKEDRMSINKGEINNHEALMLMVKADDDRILMAIFIDYNNKVYYVSAEGTSEGVMDVLNIIDNSWDPEK